MTKYKIHINGQSQTFSDLQMAKDRVKQLMDANIWFIQLEEIE